MHEVNAAWHGHAGPQKCTVLSEAYANICRLQSVAALEPQSRHKSALWLYSGQIKTLQPAGIMLTV